MYNVRIFSADAKATSNVTGRYRPGDRHAMLIFHRQAVGTEHDWAQAEAGAVDAGWIDVSLQRAGTLDSENLNGKDSDFRDAFEHAMHGGCGLVVYREPLNVDDVA